MSNSDFLDESEFSSVSPDHEPWGTMGGLSTLTNRRIDDSMFMNNFSCAEAEAFGSTTISSIDLDSKH